MGKINANGSIAYLLLPLVFLGLSGMAGAVDIAFYSSSSGCGGSGYAFNGIGAQICCIATGGSVLISNMDGCKTGVVYFGSGCGGSPAGSSTGNVCWVGGPFNAAYWYQSCRRRSLLEDMSPDTTECKGQSKPNGVVYTEDSKKGTWVLKSSDAEGMFSQMESLPETEKVKWLQSHGAVFDPSMVE